MSKLHHLVLVVAAAYLALGVAAGSACTPAQRGAARTALDAARIACIIANAALPDEKVRAICNVADDLIDPMKDILSGARAAGCREQMDGGAR
jgi:hypothetical protein